MEAKAIIAKRASLDSMLVKHTEMLGNDLDRHLKVLLRVIGMMKKIVTETPELDSIPTVVDSFKKMVSDHSELLQWAQKFDRWLDRSCLGFCVGERVPNGWRVDFCG